MATEVLPGGICNGIRRIQPPDGVQVVTNSNRQILGPRLAVIEGGDTRLLPISREVAEVLIAYGFSYEG